jgi:hypothetical protein
MVLTMVRKSRLQVVTKKLTLSLTLGRNDLGGGTIKEESVDGEMYTDLEYKVEEIDQPVDARWATWATESSTRFAW